MTHPAWSATVGEPGARLSAEVLQRCIDAVAAIEPRPVVTIFPGPILGHNQYARRHRTVTTKSGVRLELPNGANPYIYIWTGGESW